MESCGRTARMLPKGGRAVIDGLGTRFSQLRLWITSGLPTIRGLLDSVNISAFAVTYRVEGGRRRARRFPSTYYEGDPPGTTSSQVAVRLQLTRIGPLGRSGATFPTVPRQ